MIWNKSNTNLLSHRFDSYQNSKHSLDFKLNKKSLCFVIFVNFFYLKNSPIKNAQPQKLSRTAFPNSILFFFIIIEYCNSISSYILLLLLFWRLVLNREINNHYYYKSVIIIIISSRVRSRVSKSQWNKNRFLELKKVFFIIWNKKGKRLFDCEI